MLAVVILMPCEKIYSQMPIKYNMVKQIDPDSADVDYYKKKHFWRAGAEVVGLTSDYGLSTGLCSMEDWSYINFHTIKENFKHGFISAMLTYNFENWE